MATAKITKEQAIERYKGKLEQCSREYTALENDKSYLLLGEKDQDGNLTKEGETIKTNALGYNEIMIQVYEDFIKVLKNIR